MPTKRSDETQDASIIQCVRDDEAAACIVALLDAEADLIREGYEHPQLLRALIGVLQKRIADRS